MNWIFNWHWRGMLSIVLMLHLSGVLAIAAIPRIDSDFRTGSGADGGISEIYILPGGKILVGGQFDHFDSKERRNLARLLPNGRVDGFKSDFASHVPDYHAPAITSIVAQSNRRILIGGYFGLQRITFNGRLDRSFSSEVPGVNALLLQSDGRILAGLNGLTVPFIFRSIVRLHSDGSVDPTFDCLMTRNTQVFCMLPFSADSVLAGGNFQSVNGSAVHRRLAALRSDGSVDTNFTSAYIGGGYPNAWDIAPYDVERQPDGKIVVAGLFQYVGGIPRGYVARLHPDGSHDPTFNSGEGAVGFNYVVNSIAIQPDGRIICAGEFTSYNGVPRNYLARLNPDGSLDEDFNSGDGPSGPLSKVLLLKNNLVLIGGSFSTFDGVPQGGIARLIVEANDRENEKRHRR